MNSPDFHSRPDSARPPLSGLYVLTSEHWAGHLSIARAALNGGARIIQLRDKSTSYDRLLPIAHQLRALTAQFNALLIINDDFDLALECRADGVHLGPDDATLSQARQILGEEFLIGVSCGTVAEAVQAQNAGANYLGVGAIFSTSTKTDAGAPIGLDGLRAIRAQTVLPIAAIGGLELSNISHVARARAEMACVISAIANQSNEANMQRATQDLLRVWQEGNSQAL